MDNFYTGLSRIPSLAGVGKPLIEWDRWWCPLGASIRMETFGLFDHLPRQGFLAEPNNWTNSNCQPLRQRLAGDSGVWALCGPPGSGKSASISQWLELQRKETPSALCYAVSAESLEYEGNFERLLAQPRFKNMHDSGSRVILVIDGFDQFRRHEGTLFASLATALENAGGLDRIRVVISCRSRDWDELGGQHLLDLWPRQPEQKLEICPLTRAEVELAVRSKLDQPSEKFLQEITSRGLMAAAQWPLSLRSLLDECLSVDIEPCGTTFRLGDFDRDPRAYYRTPAADHGIHARQLRGVFGIGVYYAPGFASA